MSSPSQESYSVMEAGTDKEVAKLADYEETSDKYLNELMQQIVELRRKLGEEKQYNLELNEIKSNRLGHVEVHYQRIADLNVADAEKMMAQIKYELQIAKEEDNEVCDEVLMLSLRLLKTVQKTTNELEDLRMQYKNPISRSRHLALEVERNQYLENFLKNLKDRVASKGLQLKELISSNEIFELADMFLYQLTDDSKNSTNEAQKLMLKLQNLENANF